MQRTCQVEVFGFLAIDKVAGKRGKTRKNAQQIGKSSGWLDYVQNNVVSKKTYQHKLSVPELFLVLIAQ